MGTEATLIYRLDRRKTDGGYLVDTITIAECDEVDTADRLAGTVDNRDGYGGDGAERMGRVFAQLLRDGHPQHYDTRTDGHWFKVEFQVYSETPGEPTQWCDPRFTWPDKYIACGWAHALMSKIGKRIERAKAKAGGYGDRPAAVSDYHTFKNGHPEIVRALAAMGAIMAEDWKEDGGPYPMRFYVKVRDKANEYSLTA